MRPLSIWSMQWALERHCHLNTKDEYLPRRDVSMVQRDVVSPQRDVVELEKEQIDPTLSLASDSDESLVVKVIEEMSLRDGKPSRDATDLSVNAVV